MTHVTHKVIGILVLLLALGGGTWGFWYFNNHPVYAVDHTAEAEEDESEDEEDADEEENEDSEEEDSETTEKNEKEIQLGASAQKTLEMIRSFWKRGTVTRQKQADEFPPFVVPPRKGELENYPCKDCHEDEEINIDKERTLTEEHAEIVLDHGGGRFWCLTCHNLHQMDTLRSLKETKIDFDQSYLLCGQCHSARQKDWYFGAHGKRIGNWKGERRILLCAECHDPHSPSLKPKPPNAPPQVRKNLKYVPTQYHARLKAWEHDQTQGTEESRGK